MAKAAKTAARPRRPRPARRSPPLPSRAAQVGPCHGGAEQHWDRRKRPGTAGSAAWPWAVLTLLCLGGWYGAARVAATGAADAAGSQRQLTAGSCPWTCSTASLSCDAFFDAYGATYSCAYLESAGGCDCSGCLCGGTAAPSLTPAPSAALERVNFTAANFQELYDGLGTGLFSGSAYAGHFEVNLLGPIYVQATLWVGPHTKVVFKSSNGRCELSGGSAWRVLLVMGDGASVALDGVVVRDGRHSGRGGCIVVDGSGATRTLDGGAVVSGCEAVGDDGVRLASVWQLLRQCSVIVMGRLHYHVSSTRNPLPPYPLSLVAGSPSYSGQRRPSPAALP